jgi:hypothetical protein
MSKGQSSGHAEDIDLDEHASESVIGGAGAFKNPDAGIHKSNMTASQAMKAGYEAVGSARDGDVLMRNVKTGKEILIR